jgi:ABC-2 type transport system ATP-binding protein
LLSELEGTLSDILLIEQGRVVLNKPIDDVRQSAYRVDGTSDAIERYIKGKQVITKKISKLTRFAIVYEPLTDATMEAIKAQELSISPVRAEELCVFLTQQNKEDELECLW